jgi:TolA-binding protein
MKKIVLVLLVGFTSIGVCQDTKENADFKLAINLFNDKLYDLAAEQFRQFVNLYPNTQNGIEARFYLGLAQSRLGKHDDARITFQNFALAFPDHPKAPEAWWNVGEAYLALKNTREAALAFERVRTFHPRSKLAPAGLLRASELFETLGDVETTRKLLRTLTQEYSSADVVHPARLRLAQYAIDEGQYEVARIEFKKVVDGTKDPSLKAQALLRLAETVALLGKSEEAQNLLKDIIKNFRSTESYYPALLALGRLQNELGNTTEALATFKGVADDSLKAPPDVRQVALLAIGDFYAGLPDFAKALPFFERAAGLRGMRNGEGWYKAGIAAEKTNNLSKASLYYSRASADTMGKVSRQAILAAAFRGAVLSKSYFEAVKIAERFRQEFPNDRLVPRMLYEAGQVYLQLKDPRAALELFDEVLTTYPAHPYADDAAFSFAVAQHQLERLEEALAAYANLITRYPTSDYVEEAKQASRRIQLFEMKNKEAGLEKLALLIGDVIAQKSKGDLAFRLAEIYFHDLRDYENAARQYTAALESDLEETKRPTAWYYRARSYDYLAWRDYVDRNDRRSVYATRAMALYDSLLTKYPANEFREEATSSLFEYRIRTAQSVPELRKILDELQKVTLSARRRDALLLDLGLALREAKSLEDALNACGKALVKQGKMEQNPDAQFWYGKILFEMGEQDSATVILSVYRQQFPRDRHAAEALWLLGNAFAAVGRAGAASEVYDVLTREFPTTRFAQQIDRLRADAYFAANDFGNAYTFYLRHVQSVQQNFFELPEIGIDILERLALCAEKLGKRLEAKRYYATILQRSPSPAQTAQIYYSLAAIARDERNLGLAAKYLQEANRLSPASTEQFNRAALEAAELLFKTEDYTTASARFAEVAQRAQGDSIQQYLQSRIIVCYFRLDNLKEADRRATSFVKSFPKAEGYAAEFEYERGRYHLRRDELPQALKRFENVLVRYPKAEIVPETMYWVARTYELDQKPQVAVQYYDSILARFPSHPIIPRTQLSLGNAYYNLEQWDKAARLYKSLVDSAQKAPDLVQFAMSNLIMTYKELTLYDAALDLTRKYIDRYPDDPELINKKVDIGVLFQKLGYYDQSIFHLQSLLEGADADLEAELRYYIGEAYYYKREYQQAILEFLKVPYLVTRRTRVDWVATSYYMAGQSYEKMSKFEQAISMYRQIIDRPGIDQQFKIAAQKEIDRVNLLVKSR